MKSKIFNFVFLLILSPFCSPISYGYQTLNSSIGKVIVDIDQEEALEKFGVPIAAYEDIWHYSAEEEFFVYFASPLSLHIYPVLCELPMFVPLEFRVFASFPNLEIKDVTSESEFLFSDYSGFITDKEGAIITKKPGDYVILAKYKGIFSNPCYLRVKEGKITKVKEEERLLAIDVLPYKPEIARTDTLEFVALGTFLNQEKNKYSVREISYGAHWFFGKDENFIRAEGRLINFHQVGKFNVFCKYNNLESYHQECEVKDASISFKQGIKHITLLPEFMSVYSGENITLKAYGTYYNNKVEDITDKVLWDINKKELLQGLGGGVFLTRSRGIVSVFARLGEVKSLPVKIVISITDEKQRDVAIMPPDFYKNKIEEIKRKDVIRQMRNDAYRLSDVFLKKDRTLSIIKIIPDYLKVNLGMEGKISALGIYSDNSQEDLTLLGEWHSSDIRIATVSGGKVSTFSTGQINANLSFHGVTSPQATVVVEPAKLVSIILNPHHSKISIKDNLTLRAEGYYTDSSLKEITHLVNWEITPSGLIKIEKGMVKPLWFGLTKVRAEYEGIKSLPVNIKVILTFEWLMGVLLKIILFMFLGIIVIFMTFYLLTISARNKLLAYFHKDPRWFIVNLYDNLKIILVVFGLGNKERLPPLSYARMVENIKSIEDNCLLRLTVKFEEAKYSHHILQGTDALVALDTYNEFLQTLFSRYNKLYLLYKYCLTLIHRIPLRLYITVNQDDAASCQTNSKML